MEAGGSEPQHGIENTQLIENARLTIHTKLRNWISFVQILYGSFWGWLLRSLGRNIRSAVIRARPSETAAWTIGPCA